MARYSLTLFITIFLIACSNESTPPVDYSAAGEPTAGDTLIRAVGSQASGLVPWLAGESAASEIASRVYRTLLTYDAELNIIGDLATNWEISSDGRTIHFTIDPLAKWHDGMPVNARDVKATYEALIDPNTRTPYAADYKLITEFNIISGNEFSVTYAEPFAPALTSWAGFTVLPAHILALDDDFNETRLKHTPLGNNYYRISNRQATTFTEFSALRNGSEYPYIDKLKYEIIPDQDTQFLELKAGNIDTMLLKPVQAARLTDGERFSREYAKYTFLSNGYTFVGFNLNHPALADKTLRQALSYATPREQIINAVLFGYGKPIIGPYKPGTRWHHPELAPYPFDLARAQQLLEAAGWHDQDGDGIRGKELNGEYTELRFTLVTNQGNDLRIKTAEILQHFWRQLGVTLKIEVQEWATFVENTLHGRDFDMIILGWALTPEPDQYIIWHSSQREPRQFNVVGFANTAVDNLLEEGRMTLDLNKREQLYHRFQEILHEEQPYLFLYAPEATVALHRRVKNAEPAPAGLWYNQEEWYVPHTQQLRTELTP